MSIDNAKQVNPMVKKIGMALSGGGTRAVGFHIGTLEYLHRLKLMSRVTMLSAASGGSFVAAKYSLLLAEFLRGKNFNPERDNGWAGEYDKFFNLFFKEFYCDLRDIRFVEYISKVIDLPREKTDSYDIPSGRYTLINAAADLYAQTFLKSAASGQTYLLGDLTQRPPGYPLKHVIFNAADFQNCVAFRFCGNPESDIGNVYFYEDYKGTDPDIRLTVRRECCSVRVADIVAASSCIPPLYEPIGFPDDFAWPSGKIPSGIGNLCSWGEEKGVRISRPLPLMDGGLYDNQAIESLVLADRGRDLKEMDYLLQAQKWEGEHPSELDMLIVSDADRKDKKHSKFDYDKKRRNREFGDFSGGLSIGTVVLLLIIVFAVTEGLLCLALTRILSDAYRVWQGEALMDWLAFVAGVIHLFLIAVLAYGGMRTYRLFRKLMRALKKTPQVGGSIIKTIFRLKLRRLFDGINFRLFSVMETIFDVLLKRTRDLEYDVFYSDSNYYNKRVSNMLYQLRPEVDTSTLPGAEKEWQKVKHLFKASDRLTLCVQRANDVETRFWFEEDKPWEQQSLVASGQATICYNMARYVVRNYNGDPQNFPPNVKNLWDRLVCDWQKLNDDPYVLLKERFAINNMDDELIFPPPYKKN